LDLAIVLDAFRRKAVGGAMEAHLRTELVLQALQRTIGTTDAAQCDPWYSDQRANTTRHD
jgi:hypothetical protein